MKRVAKETFVATVCGLAACAGSAAYAGDTLGREFSSPYTSLRVMNAGKRGDAWQSGLHVTMQTGWKTYWRMPGDGGVPPQFDWSASDNVKTANVMMPLPHRFSDENGEGIGYKSEVVFPVDVTPIDASKPATVLLKMFYAVCNDICVPVQAEVKHMLNADTVSASDSFRLKQARKAVPVPVSAGSLSVTAMKQVSIDGKPAIEMTLKGMKHPSAADVFVEAQGTSYFRKPELIGQSGDETIWRLMIDSYGKAPDLAGKPVRLTIADGETGLVHEGVLQ
jgi:DsbC/DsbD-like thiol-disulfide interchange protein